MTNTYKTICQLISTAMFGGAVSYGSDINWKKVFVEMKAQRIAGIVFDILSDIDMDTSLKKEWKRYVLLQNLYYDEIINAQEELCRALEDIPYVVIKGTAVARYYPNPSRRNMGDIDILIKGGADEAKEAIIGKGYILKSEYTWRHVGLKKDRIEVELHIKCDNMYINELSANAVKKRVRQKLEKCEFYSLPEKENGLVLLSHIARHMQEGIGLRQVIDWMMFVANHDNMEWDSFNRESEKAGLFNCQCIITKMCTIYFGLPIVKEIEWCNTGNDLVCDRLLDYLFQCGNFGNKNRGFAGKLIMRNKLRYFIDRLQRGGINRRDIFNKYCWLKPFAWIFQLYRILIVICSRENPIKSIKKDIKDSKSIENLMKDLGLSCTSARCY